MVPTPTALALITAQIGYVSFQFTGAVGVDHYDVYRSQDPKQIGSIINVAPIVEPGGPSYDITFIDDGVFTTSAPTGPSVYFYKVVATDGAGNVSLPSDTLEVNINLPQDFTPERTRLIQVEVRGN